ncbi:MAG: homocysteine S-methyltransferase family protein [Actinobacteria bacterium]|nr:homocysteine S-methyltransferase family protein [Actinomycetota bacterium]
MSTVVDAIREGNVRVGDGAMGTMLQEAGLDDAAGSRLLTTNTFGGSRPRLAMHGLEDRVVELNEAAARVARSVADAHPGTFVLGDVGPSGDLMEPMGTLTPESAVALFSEQIAALSAGGADAILIETMSDLSEVEAAVTAARAVAPELPVFATMSFDTNLRTMMGVTPAAAVVAIAGMGADVVGANCGRGVDEMRVIAGQMADARPDGVLLIMQSNAGLPVLIDGEFRYTGSPDEMAAFATEMRGIGIDVVGACCGFGIDVVGACCGSAPAHIAAISAAIA